MPQKPELLSPAGSPESLRAAVEAGADAVYLAGKRFGARRSAANFTDGELKEALRYVHLAGAKAYVTVNTVLYDDELGGALDFLADIYSWGADAAIVQDVGLVALAKESVPIELHASTQFGVHDSNGARAAKSLGFSRAIVARETPITDVAEISEAIDTEVFVHGALCYSYSGQCLMSSFIGGRSGNRGSCSQPCRMQYAAGGVVLRGDGKYLLSTRDLKTLDRLGEIVDAGVKGLKIEGRLRSPEYVALATSAYRKALDTCEAPDGEARSMLALAFNREFTRGYVLGARHAGLTNHAAQSNAGLRLGKVVSTRGSWMRIRLYQGMRVGPGDGVGLGEGGGAVLAVETLADGLVDIKVDAAAKAGDEARLTSSSRLSIAAARAMVGRRRSLRLSIDISPGEPVKMVAMEGAHTVSLDGPVAADADKRPITEESVRGAVGPLGDTPFEIERLDISIDGRAFVPVGAIKEMRRQATSAMEKKISESFIRARPEAKILALPWRKGGRDVPRLVARTRDSQAAAKLAGAGADVVLVDALYGLPNADTGFLDILKEVPGAVLELPRITTNAFWRRAGETLKSWKGPTMVHSLGARNFLGKSASLGGYSLNVANSHSASALAGLFESVEASPEASAVEIRAIASVADAWVAVQGRQEVMVSEDCIAGSEEKCERCGDADSTGAVESPESGLAKGCGARRLFSIRDLKGYRFPALVDADCRTHIFNSAETCLADDLPAVVETGAGGLVLNLQLKEACDAIEIVRIYRRMLSSVTEGFKPSGKDLRALKELSGPSLTRGHFAERAP